MGACVVCGAPLDGESRFWCRAHYIVLGSFKMTVTPGLMGLVQGPPRPVFRELLRDEIKRRGVLHVWEGAREGRRSESSD